MNLLPRTLRGRLAAGALIALVLGLGGSCTLGATSRPRDPARPTIQGVGKCIGDPRACLDRG